jgi:hypothetical protein
MVGSDFYFQEISQRKLSRKNYFVKKRHFVKHKVSNYGAFNFSGGVYQYLLI